MPSRHDPGFPYRNELEMPVIGLESEFKVFIDDREVSPEEIWRTPSAFIDRPLLRRTSKSLQLPTGGAVYFDGGVVEVATPVIEIAPQCTARVVRSLWEQIAFVRDQLDRWEQRNGNLVRLQAFSCHCNISYELSREERSRDRTIQKLAFLLAHLLPAPVIVAGANRRSTGIGVRPRRDRVETTLDFTPDPGLMSATILENFAALDRSPVPRRRRSDVEQLGPPWRGEAAGRRTHVRKPARRFERRDRDRRSRPDPIPPPRLSRSAYEKVFVKLGSGKRLQIGDEILTPVAVKGWYHSLFVNRKGEERMLSIDQILHSGHWKS